MTWRSGFLDDLSDEIASMEPNDLIEALANRFGLTISIGSTSSKFVHHQTFWAKGVKKSELVRIQDPDDTDLISIQWVKVEPQVRAPG